MNIVGLSAFFHDAARCLLRDGVLVAAVEEERWSRCKHDPRLPLRSFRHCLDAAGLAITDIDCLAYYETSARKRDRRCRQRAPISARPGLRFRSCFPRPAKKIST